MNTTLDRSVRVPEVGHLRLGVPPPHNKTNDSRGRASKTQLARGSHCKLRQALRESSYQELRSLKVQAMPDTVYLYGSVSCYFMKQMAQETIRAFLERRELVNQVRVRS